MSAPAAAPSTYLETRRLGQRHSILRPILLNMSSYF
jgi:hypothetical protein